MTETINRACIRTPRRSIRQAQSSTPRQSVRRPHGRPCARTLIPGESCRRYPKHGRISGRSAGGDSGRIREEYPSDPCDETSCPDQCDKGQPAAQFTTVHADHPAQCATSLMPNQRISSRPMIRSSYATEARRRYRYAPTTGRPSAKPNR